jgi:hypothetical protein
LSFELLKETRMKKTWLFALWFVFVVLACQIGTARTNHATQPDIALSEDSGPSGTGGCPLFPNNNIWNTPIDKLPVDPLSDTYIASIGATTGLHPDFGTVYNGEPIGIPYNLVPGDQPGVQVSFQYDSESDHVLYPIPDNPLIEAGSDRHILIIDTGHCGLYELFAAEKLGDAWVAGSGAFFNLYSNDLRPDGWTSADAAGLPILPGLVRYDEVESGQINHALRFTANQTRDEHIWPARHDASDLSEAIYPPMGLRFRLKADFDISGYSPQVQVILAALKTYGIILADNGSDWYISGVPDQRWVDDTLVNELRMVKGTDFEAVSTSILMVNPDSGQVRSGLSDRLWLPLIASR